MRGLMADEKLLSEALSLAKGGRFEFMEQQRALLAAKGGKPQPAEQGQFVLRVADPKA